MSIEAETGFVKAIVGGRDFRVGCQPGEEPHLRQAAALKMPVGDCSPMLL